MATAHREGGVIWGTERGRDLKKPHVLCTESKGLQRKIMGSVSPEGEEGVVTAQALCRTGREISQVEGGAQEVTRKPGRLLEATKDIFTGENRQR